MGSVLGGDTTTIHWSPRGRAIKLPSLHLLDAPEDVSCAKSRKECVNPGNQRGRNLRAKIKPGTGDSLHTQEPVTVASFRTWRGWREYVAWDRCLTILILTFADGLFSPPRI